MGYLKVILFILLIFSLEKKSVAQGTATGCLLPDNKVYTSPTTVLGTTIYSNTPSVSLSTNYCTWTAPSTTSCNVCTGSLNLISLVCLGGPVVQGQEGVFTMVECPIDNITWLILFVSGFFGIAAIKKMGIT
ncbi:hypothetical protein [Pedobacter rhodius]|uniref:Uncharacterized protein n=1 Tax=Pedobacter rhodius TaxID=3004098 RepID=A0ABT4KUA5_9SPHI|nr:hypothetical protein [Pedobacter sp. SJ11]MCZ4221822.1 hypothetical protein [Pedobacter sp. SJ11]